MLQLEKNLIKKVREDLREIHCVYSNNLLTNPKKKTTILEDIHMWEETVIEKNMVLQELKIQNQQIFVYDMDNCVCEPIVSSTNNNPFLLLFSMHGKMTYDAESKIISLISTKEWYYSKYNALILNGWIGLFEVLSNDFKDSFCISMYSSNEEFEIHKNILVKRMLNYLRKVNYLTISQADRHMLNCIGYDSDAAHKFEELANLVYYIKMAERIYNSKDYIYFNAFVTEYETLQMYQKNSASLYEKYKEKKVRWYQKIPISLNAKSRALKMNLYLSKLIQIANQNALYHHWGINVENETKRFMEENNIEE